MRYILFKTLNLTLAKIFTYMVLLLYLARIANESDVCECLIVSVILYILIFLKLYF